MIGSLNHIAIAVPNLVEAMAKYSGPLGAKVGIPQDLVEHGVTVVFINLPNTKIELISPHGDNSPILSFLKKKILMVEYIIFAMRLIVLMMLSQN